MLLGINTVIFGMTDLETALQHVSWAGYECVELAAITGMAEHIKIGDDPVRIQDTLAANKLTATAIEAATNDRERLAGILELAAKLGISIVNIGSGGTANHEESTRGAINQMREFAKMASDAGVNLAVKPRTGQAVYNSDTGLRLMNEVNEPSLGLNFDPSHLARAGEDPVQVVPRWAEKIIASHFRDSVTREPGPPGTPEQQIPGRGTLDVLSILRVLGVIDYAGPLNLTIIGTRKYPLSRAMGIAAESRGYLNRCFHELRF